MLASSHDLPHHGRNEFIASIHEDDVRRLASSYHNGDLCTFFREAEHGSYNICYFVRFQSNHSCENGEKWVVRVPLAPCLAEGSKSKLEREIATMQLVADKTTIPIPKIHAYQIGDDTEPLSSFVILEYIEGKLLSNRRLKDLSGEQRKVLYTSLADIYIQLRRLEFPSIGCLVQSPEGRIVRKEIVSIGLNTQEVEGVQLSNILSSFYSDKSALTSANDFVEVLLQIADNAFVECQNRVLDRDGAEDALYHLHTFREYALAWMNQGLDEGPFVLVHGDLEPFNLLVNDNMDIVSILDWEWSRVVPLQFFKPPLWLKYPDTTKLAWPFVYEDYLKSFDQFLDVVRTRESKKYGNELLTNEWSKAKENGGFLVANALENWTDIDYFAFRYINRIWYRNKDLPERVQKFMSNNPARKALIERKLLQIIAQDDTIDTTSKQARTSSDNPAPTFATMKYFFLRRFWKETICVNPAFPRIALGAVVLIAGTSYLLIRRVVRIPSGLFHRLFHFS